MTSQLSIDAFMHAATELLLSGPLDANARQQLVPVAMAHGIHEPELDEVIRQWAAEGIVRVDAEFFQNSPVPPEQLLPEPPLHIPEANKLQFNDGPEPPPLPRPIEGDVIASASPTPPPLPGTDCARPATPPVPPLPPPVAMAPPPNQEALGVLRQRAESLLSRRRRLDSQAKLILVEEAARLGLDSTWVDWTLQELAGGGAGGVEQEASAPPEAESVTVTPEPAPERPLEPPPEPSAPEPSTPEPPSVVAEADVNIAKSSDSAAGESTQKKPPRTPADSYIKYLHKAIPKLGRAHISIRSEAKLVEEGVAKLGLGAPFATELLRQVADELDTPMLSRQSTEGDERFDNFIDRANQIIAENRGVNPRSRMLMSAMGGELGLDEDELDQAINLLTKGTEQSLDEEKRASFAQRLAESLPRMSDSIIIAPIKEALLEDGVVYEGLTEKVASQVLSAEAARADIPIVEREQAIKHVMGLLAPLGPISTGSAELRVIREEAMTWGLSASDFESAVAECQAQRRQQQRRERRVLTWVFGSSAAAIVAIVIGGGWFLLGHLLQGDEPAGRDGSQPGTTMAQQVDASPTDKEGGSEEPPPVVKDDAELLIATTNLRKYMQADRTAILEQTTDADVAQRVEAASAIAAHYVALESKMAIEERSDRAAAQAHVGFLEQWFRAEAEEAAAQAPLAVLLDATPVRGASPPRNPLLYEADMERTRALAAAMTQENLSPERADWLSASLDAKWGCDLDRSQSAAEVENQCLRELVVLQYENLIAAVGEPCTLEESSEANRDQPAERVWEPYHWTLSLQLVRLVHPKDPMLVDRLHLDFLTRALRLCDEPWERYDDLIRKFVYSKQPAVVLRMTSLMTETPNVELKASLAKQLCIGIGEVYRGQGAEEVARQVQSHFGGDAGGEDPSELAIKFLPLAEDLLAQAAPARLEEMAQRMIEFSHANTLGELAVSQDARSAVRYDSLLAAGPKKLAGADSAGAPPAQRGMSTVLRRQITDLKRMRNVFQRIQQFQALCRLARPNGADIDGPTAALLADYLLESKDEREQRVVLDNVSRLAAWPHLSMAMADRLRAMPGRAADVEATVLALIGGSPSEGAPWGEQLATALVAHAVTRLRTSASEPQLVEEVQDYFERMYELQAEARGVTLEGEGQWSMPELLAAMLSNTAAKIADRERLDAEDRQWLESLDFMLNAAQNEPDGLARAVWLQRAWARMLRLEWEAREQAPWPPARVVESQLEAVDRDAANLWQQLYEGELALLQLRGLLAKEATQ